MRILVTHQKGGVGKTTITIAIAKLFALQNISVAIVDNDQQGSVAQFKDIYSPAGINVYQLLSPEQIQQLKEEVVLIDTPPYLLNQLNALSNIVNLVLIPTKASVLDLQAIKKTIDILKEEQMDNKACVLFNMIDKKLVLNVEIKEIIQGYDIHILENYLTESVEFKNLVLDDFKYKSKRQVSKVVDELFHFIEQ